VSNKTLREFTDFLYDNNLISQNEIDDIHSHDDLFLAALEQNTIQPKDLIYKDDYIFDFEERLEEWLSYVKARREVR
jgi:calcineurin-like phosphoesterase family protein